jgi:hypothetical protein
VPFDIRQSPLDAVVFEGEFFVVQPQQVKDRRVEVVERVGVFDRLFAKLIRLAGADPRFDAGAGQPAREAVGVVIASFGPFLEEGHAAEFGAPDDEGLIQ